MSILKSTLLVGYALTLVVVLAFAVYPSVAPIALADGCSPFGFVIMTMMVALIGTSILARTRGVAILPKQGEVVGRLILGSLFFLEHVCLLFALTYLKVPVAMSLVYTYPFMIGLVGVVTGVCVASWYLFGALVICLAGISLVLGFSVDQIHSLGVLFAVLQAGLAASRIILAARLARVADGLALTTQMLAVGVLLGIVTVPIVAISPPTSASGCFAILAAGISGMIGHTCLMLALQRIGSVPFGVIMNLEPVAAAVLAAVVAGQFLTYPQYAGAFLVVAAVVWYGITEKRRASV